MVFGAAQPVLDPARPNTLDFPPSPARFVRVMLYDAGQGACLDELEVYGPAGGTNLALAVLGSRAAASSTLPGYAIHKVAHLNDGRYGNSQSWVAGAARKEWAQIELSAVTTVGRVILSRDREGRFRDRTPSALEVRLSEDGAVWKTVARRGGPLAPESPAKEEDLLNYAFACEEKSWRSVDPGDPTARVLRQMEAMAARLAEEGVDTALERSQTAELRRRWEAGDTGEGLRLEARLAKRRLFLRAPQLAAVERVLFVKRHPYEPSHNYSVLLDAQGAQGGGVYALDVPRPSGRIEPGLARLSCLFDSKGGLARDPAASADGRTVYFGYRSEPSDYFHLWRMDASGTGAAPMTDGPFHDFFPCPLPDGGLAFMSTRCKSRYLCWRPQVFTLFRTDARGGSIEALSHANLSEWYPSTMGDGRILWTRSEYLDKGADFGHTLWAVRPDGTHPELVFGNNTSYCYAGAREVPGTSEILCTIVSHGGDLNGPLALIDPRKGRGDVSAITRITPDSAPRFHMDWARQECYRDPFPVGRDYYLASHAAADRFGLYLVDRWGNRELLYLDPDMGSMAPTLLRPVSPGPRVGGGTQGELASGAPGRLLVADVYAGLGPQVARGSVKYIRVCEEVRSDLAVDPAGGYRKDYEPFLEWYATPVHKVTGPSGWPSYVAKTDLGVAPVEADGSAHFLVPPGRVVYFELLDAQWNEVQRMRSVMQLQPGETRGCVGCHESRMAAAPGRLRPPLAAGRPAAALETPAWGAGPFSYEKIVQPVWNARCASCHDGRDAAHATLAATRDAERVPASYRTLIEKGWVNYFDCTWGREHHKAPPLSFGAIKSRLCQVLEKPHYDTVLTPDESRRVKTWIALNCPLWPDYQFRPERGLAAAPGK